MASSRATTAVDTPAASAAVPPELDDEQIVIEEEATEDAAPDAVPAAAEVALDPMTDDAAVPSPPASAPRPRTADVAIDKDERPSLDSDDPWAVREADRYLRAGQIPSVAKAQGVNVLALAKRNGLYLWIVLGECVLICGLTVAIAATIIGMPAKAVPASKQVQIYQKVQQERSGVLHFAEMIAARMETWQHWTVKSNPRRVTPYLDPGIRGVYEAEFIEHSRDADRYDERHIFEPAMCLYKGVRQETKHVVMVFYKAYVGRGTDEKDFKLDRVSRRAKILEIAEGPVSAENEYGLYVLNHHDLSEQQYQDRFDDNPWETAEGVSEAKIKQRAADRKRKQEKAAREAARKPAAAGGGAP